MCSKRLLNRLIKKSFRAYNTVQPIELIPNDYPPENITLPDDRIYLRDADSFWIM